MERLASAKAECADSDGRFEQSGEPRGLCILQDDNPAFYCFLARTAVEPHGHARLISPAPLFCAPNAPCFFPQPAFPFTLSMIRSTYPPNIQKRRINTFDQTFLCSGSWRQIISNLFSPSPLPKALPLCVEPTHRPQQSLDLVLFRTFLCIHPIFPNPFPSKSVSYPPTERVFLIYRPICPPTFLSFTRDLSSIIDR
jgi:hypothetical protein